MLTQSYPHIEYIVMDGGSTDQSVDILKSYGDRFFWKSEKDGGQSAAINEGMARANGQILAFLNSDDVLAPGAIQRVVDHFQANPECDMVYGRARYIDADGNVTGDYRTDEYSFQRLMHDCCVCQPAAFWQARIAAKPGSLTIPCTWPSTTTYWLRIDRAGGRIHHIHDILADSRLYPDTKTLSLRGTSYDETFAVCMKHGGYVDYNYFQGLWHHRVTERQTGWPRFFRPLPGSFLLLSWMHHKVFEAQPLRLKADGGSNAQSNRVAYLAACHWPAGLYLMACTCSESWRRRGLKDSCRIIGWRPGAGRPTAQGFRPAPSPYRLFAARHAGHGKGR